MAAFSFIASRWGIRQGPRPRLRDFNPQTPFFASHLYSSQIKRAINAKRRRGLGTPGNSHSCAASGTPCDFRRSACLFPPGNAHSRGFQPLLVVPDVPPACFAHWARQASVPLAAAVSGPRLGVLGDEIPQRFYIAKRSKIRQSGSEANPDGRRSNSPVFLRVVLQLVFSERIWKAKKATIMQKTHPLRRLHLSCILQTAIHSAYRMKGRFA